MNDTMTQDETLLRYGFHIHDWGGEAQEIEFSEMIVVLISLFCFSLAAAHVINHRMNVRMIPEAAIIMIVGIISGGLASLVRGDISGNLLSFSPATFFIIFLPPIIFDSGYKVNFGYFFGNIGAILTYAVLGTAISSLIIGGIVHLVGSRDFQTPFEFSESLTFGSLLSATDPVSVLAVFSDLQVEPTLFNIVFGESVLNDAVGLVLFNTFSKFIGYSHGSLSALIAVLEFLFVFTCSMALGALTGALGSLALRGLHLDVDHRRLEIAFFFLMAYLPYMLAESLSLSGILSVLVSGMVTKHYTQQNLVDEYSKNLTETISEVLAYLSESFVFLNLGLSVFGFTDKSHYHFKFIVVTIAACLIARAAMIILLTSFINCFRRKKIDLVTVFMIWFAGLRGAVAYACATIFPDENGHRRIILVTTMMVVLFTVLVKGMLTLPLLRCLGIELNVDVNALPSLPMSACARGLLKIDNNYLLPILVKDPCQGGPSSYEKTSGDFPPGVEMITRDLVDSVVSSPASSTDARARSLNQKPYDDPAAASSDGEEEVVIDLLKASRI